MTTPHHVAPDDEGRHDPDADDLWNESYYCDFVDAGGDYGGWLRLGLYPNRQVAWWTTWIVRPGHAAVCSVDYEAPVPPGHGLVSESVDSGRIEIDIRRPLEEFRLAARTPAFVFTDPADVYTHGETAGRAGRTRPRPDLEHRRRPLRLRRHHSIRDPLPGGRQRDHRRRHTPHRGPGPARSLLGRA